MKIEKIIISKHRRSAFARYIGKGFRLNVYLYNNEPFTGRSGPTFVICYHKPSKGEQKRSEFESYAEFLKYRRSLIIAP